MLKGKTALVTGASRGIGRAVALGLAENGADIAAVYAGNEQAALETCALASKYGVKAKAYRADVADFTATALLAKAVAEDFGGVDILVNNAGIVRDGLIASMSEKDFDDVIATSLKGSYNMIRHLYMNFVKRRSGRIINISSVVGLSGNAGQANYAAAKAGIIGLTKSVAKELAPRGITCNAIAPGFIETDMTAALGQKQRDAALGAIPLKRFGAAGEVASLAVFLAGEGAAYITGEVIRVDGGMYI